MGGFSHMNWKSTALIAGATTLATWLAAPPQSTTSRSDAAERRTR